jgi:hypothetical protein
MDGWTLLREVVVGYSKRIVQELHPLSWVDRSTTLNGLGDSHGFGTIAHFFLFFFFKNIAHFLSRP